MEINYYIKEILLQRNNIIIPNLGLFESEYISAKIDKANNIIYPPSKRLTFDMSENKDGNVLLNYVSKKEAISKEKANIKISKFVEHSFNKFKMGEEVYFDAIGYLYMDKSKIVFKEKIANDFMVETYGLSAFVAEEKYKSHQIDSTVEAKEIKTSAIKKRIFIKTLLLVIPILLITFVILATTTKWGGDKAKTLSNYIETIETDDIYEKYLSENIEKLKNYFKSENDSTETKNNYIDRDSLIVNKDSVENNIDTNIINKDTNNQINIDDNNKPISILKYKYYLIAGSYSTTKNAKKLIFKLTKRGYKPEVLSFKKDLYRVSVGSFNSLDKAVSKTEKFMIANKDIEIWLFENKHKDLN